MEMEQFVDFDRVDQFGPQDVRGSVQVEAEEVDHDVVEKVGDVTAEVRAESSGMAGEYLVEGTVSYQADLRCSRCLDPYPFANRASFAVRYRPSLPEAEEAQEVELAEGELDVEFYESRQIPLKHIAAEQIALSIPMKTVCEEACRGLCSTCGANLNRGECGCQESLVDPRWDALKGLREELGKKKDA
jgi:uncharacterized protein